MAAAAVALVGPWGPGAMAAPYTWDTAPAESPVAGGTGTWDLTIPNWTQDDGASKVVWGNTNADLAIFGVTGGTVTLGSPIIANALQFDVTGYSIVQGTGTLTLAGTTPTVTVANLADTATISAAILGSTGLTKAGAGTLTLSGVNTFTGGTTINGGAVSIAAEANLGAIASGVTFNGGTLTATTGFVTTRVHTIGAAGGTISITGTQYRINVANGLVGSGPLLVSGAYTNAVPANGNLRLSLANSYSGAMTIQGGSVEYEVANALAAAATITVNNPGELVVQGSSAISLPNALTVNGGALGFENGNAGIFSGPISVGASGIRVGMRDWYALATARSGTISGALSGAGDMSVVAGTGGAATLNLTGNNTGYSGAYVVDAGNNIAFASANARSTGAVTINTTATRLGGLAFGYDFGATPTFTNIRTGATTGGVFGINTVLPATTVLDMATLGGGGMFLGSTSAGTYAAATLGPDGTTYRLGGGLGALTLSGTNVLTGATAVVVGDARVNGTGTIVLSAANDYTGTTNVNGGSTLTFNNSGSLGSAATGTTVAAGGSLTFSGGITVAEPLTISGTSGTPLATNLPNALVSVSGANTISSNITIASLSAGNARISATAGTLAIGGNISYGGATSAGGLVFAGAGSFTQASTSVISGSMVLFNTTSGTTTLSGLNTFTGRVSVQGGTLVTPSINSVASPAASSGLGVPASAASTIDLGLGTTAVGLTYTGTGETTDRVINLIGSTGTVTITQSGTGLLRFTSNVTVPGAAATDQRKTFTLTGAGNGEIVGIIPNATAGTAGQLATAVTKAGAGTWTLSGANTYTGTTTLSAGTLILNNASALSGNGTVAINGGTLVNAVSAITSTGSGSIGGSFTFGTAASTSANNLTLNGTTSFTNDLNRTVTLLGTGTTLTLRSAFVNNNDASRTLAVNGPGNTLVLGGLTLLNGGTTARTQTLGGSGNLTITGPVVSGTSTGIQTLTYSGTGVLTLGGINTYTGPTNANNGLVRFNGVSTGASAVTIGATGAVGGTGTIPGTVTATAGGRLDLRDGAVGTLTLGSTLTLNGTAAVPNNLYFDLGNGSGTVDRIAATGAVTAATANGALISFNQLAGTPLNDGTYTLITSGATSNVTGFALATTQSGGHTYSLTTATTGNIVQVTVGTAVASTATTAVWGGSTSNLWTAAGNWYTDASTGTNTGAVPGIGSNVSFYTTNPAAANLSTTLGADFEINSLTFLSTATTAVTIAGGTGNALTVDAGTANGNTAGNGIDQQAAQTHIISSRLGIGAAQTWTVAAGGGLTVSGLVFDTGPGLTLTKAGAGTLTLATVGNTFTGNINVVGGTLAFIGSGTVDQTSLGAGQKTITLTSGSVLSPTSTANPSAGTKSFVVGTGGAEFNVPTGVTLQLDDPGQFSGTGDLTVTGAGTGLVYLNNQSFNFTGNVIINSGTLRLGTNSVLGTTAGRTITVNAGGTLDTNTNVTVANVPLAITLNGGTLSAAAASGSFAHAVALTANSNVSAGAGFTETLSGAISGGFSLTKVGAGTTVLSGSNTYSAASGASTIVTAGMLHATKTASLPNYATAGQVSVTGGTLSLSVGGAGEFTAADVTTLLNNGTFATGSGIGLDTTNAGGSFTAPAIVATPSVAVLNFTKLGTGTLVLPNANGFGTGSTTILNGTLSVTSGVTNPLGTGALVIGTTNGVPANLDLGTSDQTVTTINVVSNSATANTIAIGPGNTLTATGAVTVGVNTGAALTTNLTVTGATGTFSIGTATTATNANVQIGANTTADFSNGSTVDLSGLGTFFANLGTGTFRVGDPTNSSGTSALNATLIFADTSTIQATTLTSDSPDSGRTETIRLGDVSSTINATTINIGATTSGRANGVLEFRSATGTLRVRNLAGTGRANLNIAYGGTTTGADPVSVVNLAGHSADLLLGTLQVGGRTGTSGGDSTGTFTFDTGTLDVTGINMSRRAVTATTGTLAGTSTGTVNLGGGVVTIGASGVVIAQNTSTQVGNPAIGTLNVSGGAVTIGATTGTSVTLGSSANATAGPSTAALNLTGGSLTVAGDIVPGSATGVTATLTLNGGTLNMTGKNIGSATNLVSLVAQGGVLNQLGELNGGGALTKSGTGVLSITGANTYTGPTTVSAGTLLINGSVTSNVTANGGTVGGSGSIAGALTVNAAKLAPGNSPGVLGLTGAVTLASTSTYAVEIGGPTPGNTDSNYDQTITTAGGPNTITLGGGALSAVGFNDYATSDVLSDPTKAAFILVQGGTAPVAGTFSGLPTDGSPVLFADGGSAQITYTANYDLIGGSTLSGGNDVALYNINLVPEPTAIAFLGIGAIGLLSRRRRRAMQS